MLQICEILCTTMKYIKYLGRTPSFAEPSLDMFLTWFCTFMLVSTNLYTSCAPYLLFKNLCTYLRTLLIVVPACECVFSVFACIHTFSDCLRMAWVFARILRLFLHVIAIFFVVYDHLMCFYHVLACLRMFALVSTLSNMVFIRFRMLCYVVLVI